MKKTVFRKIKSGEAIEKALEKLYGYPRRIEYDRRTKYWWVQVEGNPSDPLPKGRWYRADYFFEGHEIQLLKRELEKENR